MEDVWIERTADEFTEVIAGSLPQGEAWPRDPGGDLMRWVDGCAQIWGDVSSRSAALLVRESDPRSALEMLLDWERAYGLPEPCLAEPQTIEDRRRALVNKMTILGAQDRAFFIGIAASLGYAITITEFSPFMAGISRCGDTRPVAPADPTDTGYRWQVGPPEIRFYWRVNLVGSKTRWFRAGTGQAGVDRMVTIGLATDLECLLRRWKPAQTEIVFNYAAASTMAVQYDWFRAGESHAGADHMLAITSIGGIADT